MKKIAIIPNGGKSAWLEQTKKAVKYLDGKADLYMEDIYRDYDINADFIPREDIFDIAEIMLVLGGDGTILQCAAECAQKKIPVLGINLGRIGFMTEIETDDIENALSCLLSGEYKTEKRMLMRVEIKENGKTVKHCHALNDVVVSKPTGEKLIGIELYTDGDLVNRYIADGLVIATPTGSTGYSISAGGPVVDPLMNLYIATPICAHMLSVRSAVLPPEKEIVIRTDSTYGGQAVVSTDGDVMGRVDNADEIIITKSKYEFELIKIGNKSFYDTVLRKLS